MRGRDMHERFLLERRLGRHNKGIILKWILLSGKWKFGVRLDLYGPG
jgi:hypothetical protein